MKYDIEKLFPCHSVIVALSGRSGTMSFTCAAKIYARGGTSYPRTPTRLQQQGRGRFADAVKGWRALGEAEKNDWKRRAGRKKRTGYNLFISDYLNKALEAAEESSTVPSPALTIAAAPYHPGYRTASPPFIAAAHTLSIRSAPSSYLISPLSGNTAPARPIHFENHTQRALDPPLPLPLREGRQYSPHVVNQVAPPASVLARQDVSRPACRRTRLAPDGNPA